MNLRKTLIAAAIGGVLGLPGAASAITIDGITFGSGAVFQTVTLWEGSCATGGAITAIGQTLCGVGRVETITGDGSVTFWSNATSTHELTIYFNGYTAASVVGPLITFNGGQVSLYSQAKAGGTLADASGGPLNVNSFTDGSLWLQLTGTPDPLLGGGTLLAVQAGLQVTGVGYLDVIGGSAASFFDSNSQGDSLGADAAFTSGGTLGANGTPWAFKGSASVSGLAVNTVPEPGTLALLGAGLVGVSLRRRAKR